MRLDVYLASSGLCTSRQRGRALIENGLVTVDGVVCTKPSREVDGCCVLINGEDFPYVSRGGLKLERALDFFNISVEGKSCVDIGSSTGGFTHCLLMRGAEMVFAVDSGSDQLHSDLRGDSRVVVMEGFNARYLRKDDLGKACTVAVMDVSFISQSLLYEAVADVLTDNGVYISLIKPQFEAGKAALNKKGIVTDKKYHREVIERLRDAASSWGLSMTGLTVSPILGGSGNTEYLACFEKGGGAVVDREKIINVVYGK